MLKMPTSGSVTFRTLHQYANH